MVRPYLFDILLRGPNWPHFYLSWMKMIDRSRVKLKGAKDLCRCTCWTYRIAGNFRVRKLLQSKISGKKIANCWKPHWSHLQHSIFAKTIFTKGLQFVRYVKIFYHENFPVYDNGYQLCVSECNCKTIKALQQSRDCEVPLERLI